MVKESQSFIIEHGFTWRFDSCFSDGLDGSWIYLLVYLYEHAYCEKHVWDEFETQLSDEFDMKDVGAMKKFWEWRFIETKK